MSKRANECERERLQILQFTILQIYLPDRNKDHLCTEIIKTKLKEYSQKGIEDKEKGHCKA